MPFVKGAPVQGPCGVSPALAEDRMPVVRVVNGDSWAVEADARIPGTGEPARPDNSRVSFVLSENRFTDPIWTGTWYDGVVPDEHVPGLVRIRVPEEVSSSLRRGVYAFSMAVKGALDGRTETQLSGHFEVDYEPSSPVRDIPYR